LLRGADFAAEVEAHPPFGRYGVLADDLIRGRPRHRRGAAADADRVVARRPRSRGGARRAACCAARGLAPRGRSSDTLDGGLVAPGTLAVTDGRSTRSTRLALPIGPTRRSRRPQARRRGVGDRAPRCVIVDPASLAFCAPPTATRARACSLRS
jgi:hypothetical protein